MACSRKDKMKDIQSYNNAMDQFKDLKEKLEYRKAKLAEMRERSDRSVDMMEQRLEFLSNQWKTRAVMEQEEIDWQIQYATERLPYNKSEMLTPNEVEKLKKALSVLEEKVSRVTAFSTEAQSVFGIVAKDSMQLNEVLQRASSLEMRQQGLLGLFMTMDNKICEEQSKKLVMNAVKRLKECGEMTLAEDLKNFLSSGTSTSATTTADSSFTSGIASEEPISLPSSFPITSCSAGSSSSESQN